MTKKLLAAALACMTMTVTAFATEGAGASGTTGMDAVLGAMTTLTSLLSSVWELMTSNPLLTLFLAASLLSVGVYAFRQVKRASRG